jgi:hypothetical protein
MDLATALVVAQQHLAPLAALGGGRVGSGGLMSGWWECRVHIMKTDNAMKQVENYFRKPIEP